ncbi:MAG TPA: CHAT domain-containing protein [Longimicrobium sp.]|jgi:hypothetical protein
MSVPDSGATEPPRTLAQQLVEVYTTTGVQWGDVDLVFFGRSGTLARLSEYAVVLKRLNRGGQRIFENVCIIWPTQDEEVAAQIRNQFGELLAEMRGGPLSSAEVDVAFEGVRVAFPDTLELDSLIEVMNGATSRSAFVVAHAAWYRAPSITDAILDPAFPGDVWALHLHALLLRATAVGSASECYVLLDTGEEFSVRDEHRDLLFSVERTAVLVGGEPSVEEGIRLDHQRWLTLARSGDLEAALIEVDAREDLPQSTKTLVRLQLLDAAGFRRMVRAELDADPDIATGLVPEAALQLARLAENADADELAAQLVADALERLATRHSLELALQIAERVDDAALVTAVETRIRDYFPHSDALLRRRARSFAVEQRYVEAAALLRGVSSPETAELADFWEFLGQQAGTSGPADAAWIMEQVIERFPSRVDEAHRFCSERLIGEERVDEALRILVQEPSPGSPVTRPQEFAAIDLIQRASLRGYPIRPDVLAFALERVIGLLAAHPTDESVRFKVLRTLSPEFLGLLGTSALAVVMLSISERPVEVRRRRRPLLMGGTSEDEYRGLVHSATNWYHAGVRTAFGTRTFPEDLLEIPPDQALAGVAVLADEVARQFDEFEDHAALVFYLALATAIAPLTSEPDQDLIILRQVAMRLTQSGQMQLARDWAEQMLALTHRQGRRARLAWMSYAEVYHRSGNVQEGMLAICCAMASSPETTWEDVWYERMLMFRLLRDVELLEDARPLLGDARRALQHLGLEERQSIRVDTAELQIDTMEYNHDNTRDEARLLGLIDRGTENLRSVLSTAGELPPATVMLASLLQIARREGLAVPPETFEAFADALTRLGPGLREIAEMVGSTEPQLEQLVAIANRIQPARYTEDIGTDLHQFVRLARRLLASNAAQDPAAAIYAIEALTDHTTALPGPESRTRLIDSAAGPAEAAREIARDGLGVVMIGVGERRLYRVIVEDGALGDTVEETDETFSVDRIGAWSVAYPYGYHEAASQEFYTTTEGIGLSALPVRAVVVASTHLQGFPPNLLQISGELAGRGHRVAAAPSLTWLHAARSNPFVGDRRRLAWIPVGSRVEPFLALTVLTDLLRQTLEEHGVELSEGAEPPEGAAGAELVIVGAHGSVAEENRFFRVLRDDADMTITPASLSTSIAGVGTVILFVCSGGRLDHDPTASAVLGLAKRLLARGCRAVVAAPWPLEVVLPHQWLPTFLREWDKGVPVIDACYAANTAVRISSQEDPKRYLAMTVYGDPLITRTM